MAITFDKPDKCVLITSPQTEVAIQDLLDAIRDYEEMLDNFDIPHLAKASGKEDLGGGVLVGITLELLDGWRVKFEDRAGPATESMTISGGNIVALNAFGDNPVKPSTFTQVKIEASVSAAILNIATQVQEAVWDAAIASYNTAGTFGELVNDLRHEAFGRWEVDHNADTLTLYEIDGVTVLKVFDLTSTSDDVPNYVQRTPQ